MKPAIAVIDYGMGNLRSVQKALAAAGARATVTDSPSALRAAQAVVLPRVGSFGEAVRRLQKARLWSPIQDALVSGKPFLGICLGLQLLFERSEESPKIEGLGFLRGAVVRFPRRKGGLKVPHIGWNRVSVKKQNASPWIESIRPQRFYYFVHSYFPKPAEKKWIAATSGYGQEFCSAVAGPSLLASQFHPEKSGDEGLLFLQRFVKRVSEVTC